MHIHLYSGNVHFMEEKNELAGTVPANKDDFAGNVQANKNEFAGTILKIRSNFILFDSNFKAPFYIEGYSKRKKILTTNGPVPFLH